MYYGYTCPLIALTTDISILIYGIEQIQEIYYFSL